MQFVHASLHVTVAFTIRASLSWNKFCDKNKNNNNKKKKNEKMTNRNFATRWFRTLEVSTICAGGIATFANARGPQVSLGKC